MFIAICSRSHVSVYRTIGPLVCILLALRFYDPVVNDSVKLKSLSGFLSSKHVAYIRAQFSAIFVNNSGNVDNYIRSGIETIKVNVLCSEMVANNFNISMAKRV